MMERRRSSWVFKEMHTMAMTRNISIKKSTVLEYARLSNNKSINAYYMQHIV